LEHPISNLVPSETPLVVIRTEIEVVGAASKGSMYVGSQLCRMPSVYTIPAIYAGGLGGDSVQIRCYI
jgi:hypothetical protein